MPDAPLFQYDTVKISTLQGKDQPIEYAGCLRFILLPDPDRIERKDPESKTEEIQKWPGMEDIKGIEFRRLTDTEGEPGTLLVVYLTDEFIVRKVGDELGCGVIAGSGWHVYNNMEHVLEKKGCRFGSPPVHMTLLYKNGGKAEYYRGMLPNTDSILRRAINISIGVLDQGLGSGFGLTVKSDSREIDEKIETFRNTVSKYL